MQRILIEKLLIPIAVQVTKIPLKARNVIFVLAGCIMLGVVFINNAGLLNVRYLYKFTVNCVAFGVMILMLMQPELKPVKWSRKMMIPLAVTGVFVLLAGITRSVDYLPEAFLFLVGYPVFYLVAGNMAYAQVFRKFHLISDIMYVVLLLLCLLFFPMGAKYMGFFTNQNAFAIYLAVPFCFSLAGICADGTVWARVKNYLILGSSFALIYYSNCRSAFLAVVIAGVVAMALGQKDLKTFGKNLLIKWMPAAVCVIIMIPALLVAGRMATSCLESLGYQCTTAGTQTNMDADSLKDILAGIGTVNEEKYETDVSLNELTTGRWQIWKSFVNELGFWGHSVDYRFEIDRGPEYEYKGELLSSTSHMTILQFAYNYGIMAGVSFLLLNILGGLKSVRFAWIHGGERYAIFPVVIAVAFGAISLLESMVNSLYAPLTFFYYISLLPIMKKTDRSSSPAKANKD